MLSVVANCRHITMKFFVLVLNAVFIAVAAEPSTEERPCDRVDEYGEYFEGDMLLTTEQLKEIEDAKMSDDENEDNAPKNGLKNGAQRWPDKTVVYHIEESTFNKKQIKMIEDALQDIAAKSCVRFRKRKNKNEYAVIILFGRRGCFANVGYIQRGGPYKYQVLNLEPGCFLHGIIIHEMLHTLGFHHMQSTYDRDDYVTINFKNIRKGYENNFDKYNKATVTDFGLSYDYGSVMHYEETAFSWNGQKTIVPKKKGVKIGQRIGLSNKDTIKVNIMYNCSNEVTTTEKESIMDLNFLDDLTIPKP